MDTTTYVKEIKDKENKANLATRSSNALIAIGKIEFFL